MLANDETAAPSATSISVRVQFKDVCQVGIGTNTLILK